MTLFCGIDIQVSVRTKRTLFVPGFIEFPENKNKKEATPFTLETIHFVTNQKSPSINNLTH